MILMLANYRVVILFLIIVFICSFENRQFKPGIAIKVFRTRKSRSDNSTQPDKGEKWRLKRLKWTKTVKVRMATGEPDDGYMHAAVIDNFGPADKFKIKRLPIPEPGDNEVLVQVKAAGLNFVDTQMRSGKFSKLPPLPAILGKEAAGIVVKVGNFSEFEIGERVLCCFTGTGAYAEYVVCNKDYVVTFPKTLSFLEASTLYVSYFTAYRALIQKAKLKDKESVYINGGTGGFGIAALQIAKSKNCSVTSTFSCKEGEKLLLHLGADRVHSHRGQAKTYYAVQEYRKENGFNGFDVVLDTSAHTNLLYSVFSLSKKGRVVIVGSTGNAELNTVPFEYKEIEMLGVMLSKTPLEEFREIVSGVTKGMEEGWVKPVIEKVYKLSEIGNAHLHLETKDRTLGRCVLEF